MDTKRKSRKKVTRLTTAQVALMIGALEAAHAQGTPLYRVQAAAILHVLRETAHVHCEAAPA